MTERAERREVPGAGESCRHTRWRLGESGPVWGKRNICAYYHSTQKTRDGDGRGGWRKNHGPLHEQGPTKHHTLYFNGPIWGFQSRLSLAFEKARQEPAQRVTRGLEEESDLRGWRRRRRSPPLLLPPPPQPVPYTLARICLFSGPRCGVLLNVDANLRKRKGEKNRPQHVEKRAAHSILRSKPPHFSSNKHSTFQNKLDWKSISGFDKLGKALIKQHWGPEQRTFKS